MNKGDFYQKRIRPKLARRNKVEEGPMTGDRKYSPKTEDGKETEGIFYQGRNCPSIPFDKDFTKRAVPECFA
jgi:hypothetical protein